MKRLLTLLGIAVSAALVPLQSAPIRVTGSDLMAEAVGGELKRFATQNELDVSVDMRGSRLGLEALNKGAADFALLVFAEGDPRPGEEFHDAVVGYLTAVFAIPREVPLTQLHYAQIAGIFGASELTNIKRWSELGVTGSWGVRGITPVATTRQVGLGIDLVRFGVLQTPDFKSTVVMFDETARAVSRISGEEGGIAILNAPPAEGSALKALLVAKNERDVAYGPTSENLHTGDYPLRLPVHLVLRKSEARRLNFVLRHLLADETAPVLLKSGVVPLPVQARNQLVFDLENLR